MDDVASHLNSIFRIFALTFITQKTKIKQMKKLTPLKFTLLILAVFGTMLFTSCDMDTSKLKEAVEGTEESEPTSAEIGNLDIAFCDSKVENHHGCHCTFKDESGASIFMSNMDNSKSACLSINGTTEILTGRRMDERHDHFRHSFIPDWIVLDPDGDVHIFNELVDDANYEANKDLLEETMLVMNELPKEIKWRKTNEGGGEVSAELASRYEKMWKEALEYATAERAKGNHGEPLKIELSNEKYDVNVTGVVGNHNADGSDDYSGTIEVKNKKGEVIGTTDFNGACICED